MAEWLNKGEEHYNPETATEDREKDTRTEMFKHLEDMEGEEIIEMVKGMQGRSEEEIASVVENLQEYYRDKLGKEEGDKKMEEVISSAISTWDLGEQTPFLNALQDDEGVESK